MTVTLVIPAFNEGKRIGETVRAVCGLVDEVILVDDGSSDDTAEIAERNGARVLKEAENRGYINAIKRGFREARGDIVVTFDADGEFSPEDIPRLVAPIQKGDADMVQGARDVMPRFSERLLNWLANRVAPVGDSGTGFRAMRVELARALEIPSACICGILSLEARARGWRIAEVPVTLRAVSKQRRPAWHHFRQFFAVLRMMSWARAQYREGR